MVKISPVGIEQPDRTKSVGILRHQPDILIRVLRVVDKARPSQHTGAIIKDRSAFGKLAALVLLDPGRISPVEIDHLLGQLLNQRRVFPDNITPHHRLAAHLGQVRAELFDKADIGFVLSDPFAVFAALAFAQIEGFIRTEIKAVGAEQRAIFVNHPADQRKAVRIGNIQRVVVLLVPRIKGALLRMIQLTQVRKLTGSEHLIQMAEGGNRRNQLDSTVIAIAVQLQNFFRSQRVIVAPDLAEIPKQVGVLDVQLKLIDFIFRELVRKLL